VLNSTNAEHCLAIRRARPEDAERVTALIDSVWPGHIRERRPWLFTPRRMPDYLLCERGEELWGVVGAYPYDVRLNGVTFRMAGIGQVMTHPDHRGLGIMTSLLDKALGDLHAQGFDAAWLLGDRMRYSHFGFVPGGRTIRFVTTSRYLPEPPPAESVRTFDPLAELERVRRAFEESACGVAIPADELPLVLKACGVRGWATGESFALFSQEGDRMVLAAGREDEVALLLAHQASANGRREDGPRRITFDAPCRPCLLSRLGRKVYSTFSVAHSAYFRIVTLRSFLEKAARAVAGRVPDGTDTVCLRNADTGEAALLEARGGTVRVLPTDAAGAVALSTRRLCEAFFDWLPAADRQPQLSADSPLRVLMPLDFHLPWFDAIMV